MNDQRARERFELHIPVTAHEIDADGSVVQVITGNIRDVSQRGMGLVLEAMVHLNRQLVLEAQFAPQPKWFFVEVVRSHYEQDLGHVVGAHLLALPEVGPIARMITKLQRQVA